MQKVKKVPLRKCLGCNESKLKKELIRIVKNNQGVVSVDTTGKAAGRGGYICNNIDCFKNAIKTKRIQSALETAIDEDIVAELSKLINNNG